MSIINHAKFEVEKVKFSDVKVNAKHQHKIVFLNYNGNEKIRIKTPKMNVPSGLITFEKENGTDYCLFMSFGGENVCEFKETMEKLDNAIKSKLLEKKVEWLGNPKFNETLLDNQYRPIVRHSFDKVTGEELNFPPSMTVKLEKSYENNKFVDRSSKSDVKLFDKKGQEITDFNADTASGHISKGTQMTGIIELVYLSIAKTGISVKWRLLQGRVFNDKPVITDFLLSEDSDDEAEAECNEAVEIEEPEIEEAEPEAEAEAEAEPESECNEAVEPEAEIEAEAEPEIEPVKPKRRKRVVAAKV